MEYLGSSLQEGTLRDSSEDTKHSPEESDLPIVSDIHFALKLQLHLMPDDRKRWKASKHSEFSAALDCQEAMLKYAIAQTNDAVLSTSVDKAIASESATILEALREDEREREDRQMALRRGGNLAKGGFPESFESQAPPKQNCAVCFESCYPILVFK